MTHHIIWTLDGDYIQGAVTCDDEDCISRYTCKQECEMLYDVRRDQSGVSHGLYDWEGEIKPHERHSMVKDDHCNVVEFLNAEPSLLPEMQEDGKTFEIGRTAIEPVWHGEDGVTWKRANALEVATKPRTVTTVEELDALPAQSFIRERDGFHRLKEFNGTWLLCIQSGGTGESDEIELPATVLYTPAGSET